jgi:uridine phosphorylase
MRKYFRIQNEVKWEETFCREIQKFIFGRADPGELGKYLIVVLGVPSKAAERKLHNRRKVGPAVVGEFHGIPVSVAHRSGGTIQLEVFMRLVPRSTTEYVIGLGAVGALQPEIGIGDLIVPTEAIRGEGLTKYYYPPNVPAKPDPDLTDRLLQSARRCGAQVYTGTTFTTGSIMHETDELVEDWQRKGYLGVDCEASALFLLSQYCGFNCAMVMYVTDNPYTKQIFSRSFRSMLRAYRAERKAVKAIFETIAEIQ